MSYVILIYLFRPSSSSAASSIFSLGATGFGTQLVLKYLYNFAYPERKPSTVNPEESDEPKGEINDLEIKEEKAVEKPQVEEIKAQEQTNSVNTSENSENKESLTTNEIKI